MVGVDGIVPFSSVRPTFSEQGFSPPYFHSAITSARQLLLSEMQARLKCLIISVNF